MSIIDTALNSIGINAGVTDSFGATSAGGAVNLFAQAVDSLSGGSGLNASTLLTQALGGGEAVSTTPGDWTSTGYANDLVNHQPKFKFLFKVLFSGFATRDFYYYVHTVDKPRVRFNHQEVNFYNFRSKVLTSVTFEPLSVTFLDEIGNSVNEFFSAYMATQSGQGGGGVGTNNGFTKSSSSLPYKNGYAQGTSITIEQVFGNGTSSNRFIFTNPRIESFDFDELSMEENGGSTMTVMFHYDGIQCTTVAQSTLYSWGNTDLLAGGVSNANGGASSLLEAGVLVAQSATGSNMTGLFSAANGALSSQMGSNLTSDQLAAITGGNTMLPAALSGLSGQTGNNPISAYNNASVINSAGTTLNSNLQFTLNSVQSGSNLAPPGSLDSGESVVSDSSTPQYTFTTG